MTSQAKLGVADVLERAAELITPEGAWTQNAAARAADGTEVKFKARNAVCWCLDGAYERVGGSWGDAGWRFLRGVIGLSPIAWNDAPGRTQAEVVAKLREAAALARSQSIQEERG